jgi:hypothetical protein
LGLGQDDLDHLVPGKRDRVRRAASTSNDSANRCVAKSSAARASRNFSSGPDSITSSLHRAVALPLEAIMNLTDVLALLALSSSHYER